MLVEAEVILLFVFHAENRNTFRGCYSSEDDWDITVTSDNIIDLERKVAFEIVNSGIQISSAEYYTAEYLVYENNYFFLKKIARHDADFLLFAVEDSDYYNELKLKKRAEREEKEKKKRLLDKKTRLEQLKNQQRQVEAELKVLEANG